MTPTTPARLLWGIVAALLSAMLVICVAGISSHSSTATVASSGWAESVAVDGDSTPCPPSDHVVCDALDHASTASTAPALPAADLAAGPHESPSPPAVVLGSRVVAAPSLEDLSVLRL